MKVLHPNTKNSLIMVDGLNVVAEIENLSVDNDSEFLSVTIGEVGHSGCMLIYKKEWAAFKQLVEEIDAEWSV